MNLLTFLGANKYSETTYVFGDKRHTSCYCPAAVAHFYRPETTLVVVTEKAEQIHFEALADEISGVSQPVAVPIPDGHSETDLWEIFSALTGQVAEGDELIVDITNGFRSLPFLSFMAIAFLRMARQVRVNRVLYGAYDARNESNESPIFDLTPFVTLLDWTIATDRFTRFGDASDLAGLLREGMPPGVQMRDDPESRQIGQGLKNAAKTMEDISLALRLTRPLETMTTGQLLVDTLQEAAPLIRQKAPPFGLLAEQIRQAYQPLVLSDPLKKVDWQTNLQIQLDLITWYLQKDQVAQALTLAREWMVSILVYYFDCDSLIDYEACRKPVENALNNEVECHKPCPRSPLTPAFDAQLKQLANHREIGKLWDKLTHLRNDIAHVGMNMNPKDAQKIRNEANNIYPRLLTLAQTFGIKEPAHDPH